MRIPSYLSPSALMLWSKNSGGSVDYKAEFYLRYLAENRAPRMPQTEPMAVGSAFDAEIKVYYAQKLGIKFCTEEGVEIPTNTSDALFERQVEPQCRDFARSAGRDVFNFYVKCGAAADLLILLEGSMRLGYVPRFEFSLRRSVRDITGKENESTRGLDLLGKPDTYFKMVDQDGRLHGIVLDYKVNGWCSSRTTSPNKGYIMLRPDGKMHKDCWPSLHCSGMRINIACPLEQANEEWAVQLSTYGWLLGESVGGDFVTAIDQIVGPATSPRVAAHRCTVTPTFQIGVLERYKALWEIINSGYIFRDVGREASDAKQSMLDLTYLAHQSDDDVFSGMNKLFDRSEGVW